LSEKAAYYNQQGMKLIQAGRLDEAIDFF